jgi:hypothetical protein
MTKTEANARASDGVADAKGEAETDAPYAMAARTAGKDTAATCAVAVVAAA